jgi:predicted Fe-Mo cluster-binding NifX family protein
MKIAFPIVENKGIDSSDVHGHFGSAPFFVFVDHGYGFGGDLFENPDQDHQHGACNPMTALR